jgi:hypothetical protein
MIKTPLFLLTLGLATAPFALAEPVAIFNGKDLTGWHGDNPHSRGKAKTPEEIKKAIDDQQAEFLAHWKVVDGALVNDGHGPYATSDKEYGDIELTVDYKTVPLADSGIYLRGTPQVQIWDYTDPKKFNIGGDKGSGGLWNNKSPLGKDPLVLADKKLGEWNAFKIRQIGARTWVWLNDKLVVDGAIMENFWDPERKKPLPARGPIHLQTHGGEISWKNITVREIDAEEAAKVLRGDDAAAGFVSLFNGKDLTGWTGAAENYEVVDGAIRCKAGKGGVLHTPEEYGDFAVRLEFMVPPGGNNGLAIRYSGQGDPAYTGMCELQVLDNEAEKYAKLDPRQYHGSVYGMVASHRGHLRPAGQWNYQEVTVKGSTIKVEVNGSVILDADVSKVTEFMGGKPHPGKDATKGSFGFAGHGDAVAFRNVAIKKL